MALPVSEIDWEYNCEFIEVAVSMYPIEVSFV